LLGSFVHTFYWMEFESDYPGEPDTELDLASCTPLGHVPAAFAERVCVEGSGRLADGRLLNLTGECACGHLCQETGSRVCFFAEDGADAPWGYGSDGNPLVPLRSLAVDEALIPHGSLIYIPEWDGVSIPASNGIGGFVHDGCFRADDIGYGIDGRHYDLYTGTAAMWSVLEAMRATDSETTVYSSPRRCAALRR
jgi:3D (Asp-Asp-Asp) domain-containing protein